MVESANRSDIRTQVERPGFRESVFFLEIFAYGTMNSLKLY